MQLVGQRKIKEWIEQLNLENCPHFIILQGGRRSGKTLITNKLIEKLNCMKCEFNKSAEQVRKTISTIYSIKEPCVYWCEDLDKMRPEAVNSLLKVTEETPKYAYIVAHSLGNTLGTLKSRAQIFKLEPYTNSDYEEYCKINNIEIPENADVLMSSCDSLADFEYYVTSGKFKEAHELACKTLDYIGEVSKVNAFQILNKLAFKEADEGIEPVFFLTILLNEYIKRRGGVNFGKVIVVSTHTALSYLKNDVLSKQAIMNKWILDIMKGIDELC